MISSSSFVCQCKHLKYFTKRLLRLVDFYFLFFFNVRAVDFFFYWTCSWLPGLQMEESWEPSCFCIHPEGGGIYMWWWFTVRSWTSEEEEGVHGTGSAFKSLGLLPLHSSFHQPRVWTTSGQTSLTEVSHHHGRRFSRVHRPTAAAGRRLLCEWASRLHVCQPANSTAAPNLVELTLNLNIFGSCLLMVARWTEHITLIDKIASGL